MSSSATTLTPTLCCQEKHHDSPDPRGQGEGFDCVGTTHNELDVVGRKLASSPLSVPNASSTLKYPIEHVFAVKCDDVESLVPARHVFPEYREVRR